MIPVGPSRAERGRGDPGQGPALGLLAGRGISQGSQTPRVHSAPIEVHLGETEVWGRLTLLGAGHLGQTERWKRCTNEKMPALWFPHGLQSWGLEEPWGGRASSHDVPSPPPKTTLRLSTRSPRSELISDNPNPPPGQPGSVCTHPTPDPTSRTEPSPSLRSGPKLRPPPGMEREPRCPPGPRCLLGWSQG